MDDARTDDGPELETPGAAPDVRRGLLKCALGLAASVVLTLASFWAASSPAVWSPGVPILLAALAIGQMGVHLVFFLHMTTGKDNLNNALALAFGVLIVMLLVFGSLWIMYHMNHNMIPGMMHDDTHKVP